MSGAAPAAGPLAAEVVRLYTRELMTLAQVGAALGRSAAWVRRVLVAEGAEVRPRGGGSCQTAFLRARLAQARRRLQETPRPPSPPCSQCRTRPAIPGLLEGRVVGVTGRERHPKQGLCAACAGYEKEETGYEKEETVREACAAYPCSCSHASSSEGEELT